MSNILSVSKYLIQFKIFQFWDGIAMCINGLILFNNSFFDTVCLEKCLSFLYVNIFLVCRNDLCRVCVVCYIQECAYEICMVIEIEGVGCLIISVSLTKN